MRKFLFLPGLLLLFSSLAWSQGYYITDYHVDLKLREDSGLEVTETIKVFFQEQRRGIIRNIPYEGYSAMPQTADVAKRAQYGETYSLHILNVSVDDHPYTNYTQDGNLVIRIGDPDIYLRGDQTYVVKYLVYGALQEFETTAELPWNIIGNEWDAPIRNASFQISVPGNYALPEKDLLAYTGYRGSKEQNLTTRRLAGKVTGEITQGLNQGQGLSVALRLPKDLFAGFDIPARLITKYFLVRDLKTQLSLRNSGALDVKEEVQIEMIQPNSSFVRVLNIPPGQDLSGKEVFPYMDELAVQVEGMAQSDYEIHVYPSQDQTVLEIVPKSSFKSLQKIRLDYRVWGALSAQGEQMMLRWNLFSSSAPEPVEQYTLNLSLDSELEADKYLQVPYPQAMIDRLLDINRSSNAYKLTSRKRVISGKALNFNFQVNGDAEILRNMPQQVYAKQYWIQHFDTDITIGKNKKLVVHSNYYPRFRYDEGISSFYLQVPTHDYREVDGLPFFGGMNIFGRRDNYLLDFKEHENLWVGESDDPTKYLYLEDSIPSAQAEFLSLDYTTTGPIVKERNGYRLHYPVWLPAEEPMRGAVVRVKLEKEIDDKAFIPRLVTETGGLVSEMEKSDGFWVGRIDDERYAKTPVYLDVQMPKSALGSYGMMTSFRLFVHNNLAFVIAVVVLLFLLLLWRLIGKDTPGTIIARFRPPEDMPPSEAGFIYDGKLHGKDMTALIYYWAANGNLKIREIEVAKKKKPDYELIKLHNLPPAARDYEKIFFNGLFKSGNTVKLSSLKDSFYKTYNSARSAFFSFERKAGYYAKGTRGFGKLLVVLGWLCAVVIAVPLLIYSVVVNDYALSIPAIITAISLIVFGRIMPRMKGWAQDALDKLMGFREFIRAAETERLKTLIDEDPKYFGLTLPYAIVMGEGDKWADKFEGLMTTPPDWYEGYDSGTFSTRMFTYHMIHTMHDMRTTFTSTPAPSGGSGSSWSGGSSFGGGFSGGGGFGGGGGSSW